MPIPDVHDNLETFNAPRYSDEIPPGNYDGIWLWFSGSLSAAITDLDLGMVRLIADAPWGKGDVHNISIENLRMLNKHFGGVLQEWQDASNFKFSAFLPASVFGFPSSLYIPDGSSVKLHLSQTRSGSTITACTCEMSLLPFSPRPMNYLLQLSQNRYNSLGGIVPTPLKVPNLLALGLRKASTTDPDSVILSGRRRAWTINTESARAFSSWLWDMEEASDDIALLPLFSQDIGEAIGDTYKLTFTGGSGYIDYIMLQASLNTPAQKVSAVLARDTVSQGYVDARVGPAPEPIPRVDTTALVAAGEVALT